jgi:hypothetical protein
VRGWRCSGRREATGGGGRYGQAPRHTATNTYLYILDCTYPLITNNCKLGHFSKNSKKIKNGGTGGTRNSEFSKILTQFTEVSTKSKDSTGTSCEIRRQRVQQQVMARSAVVLLF